VVTAKPEDEQGRRLKGVVRLQHNLRNGAGDKENLVFLMLMVGNAFLACRNAVCGAGVNSPNDVTPISVAVCRRR